MEEKNINYNSYIEEKIENSIDYQILYASYDSNIKYSEYICDEIDKSINYAEYIAEAMRYDTFESKKYLLLLHKDKNLSDIMEMYDISEKDLQKLSIVKLKVRDYKINLLLKQD
jgi:hypothetical protein